MSELNKEDTIKQIMKILPDVEESKIREFVTNVFLPVHQEVVEAYEKEDLGETLYGPPPKHLIDERERRIMFLGSQKVDEFINSDEFKKMRQEALELLIKETKGA